MSAKLMIFLLLLCAAPRLHAQAPQDFQKFPDDTNLVSVTYTNAYNDPASDKIEVEIKLKEADLEAAAKIANGGQGDYKITALDTTLAMDKRSKGILILSADQVNDLATSTKFADVKNCELDSFPPNGPPSKGITSIFARFSPSDASDLATIGIALEANGQPTRVAFRTKAGFKKEQYLHASKPSSWSLGRFRFGVLTGLELSQDNGNFSQEDLFLQFHGDTSWRDNPAGKPNGGEDGFGPDWGNVHTGINLTLEAIPDVSTGQDFTHSEKALSLEGVLDWRCLGFGYSDGVNFDWLTLGPVTKLGIQSIRGTIDTNSNLDSVNHYSCAGLRIAEQQITGKVNDPLFRYFDITWGSVENLPGTRWMIEGILRANLSQDENSPFTWFLGIKANLGEGPDDLRVLVGTDNALGYLQGIFGSLSGLFETKSG